MIHYTYPARGIVDENNPVTVRIDGKLYGEIRKVKTGFQYFVIINNKEFSSETFSSISTLQKFLEAEF